MLNNWIMTTSPPDIKELMLLRIKHTHTPASLIHTASLIQTQPYVHVHVHLIEFMFPQNDKIIKLHKAQAKHRHTDNQHRGTQCKCKLSIFSYHYDVYVSVV